MEVTCAVVGGKAMEMIEIVAEKGEFYDYESKYADGGSSHYLPPRNISETAKKKFQKVSEKIGFLLDLDCPYRVDGFIDGENFWVMEINTLPGMTGTSLLPESYSYTTQKNFSDMCSEIVEKGLGK
jgi:D-alanine-D-alanine ligase